MGRHTGPSPAGSSDQVRLNARVFGVVQGVGVRFWTMGKAEALGLTGEFRNVDDGSVAVVAEGPEPQVRELLDWLNSDRTPGRVDRVEDDFAPAEGSFRSFRAR